MLSEDADAPGNPASKSGLNHRDIGGEAGVSRDNVYYIDSINVTDGVSRTFGANFNTEIRPTPRRANLTRTISVTRCGGWLCPRSVKWWTGLLSIPDAISQLEQLDRTLLTRRDVERLFGVSKARAATLMQTFGAELVGNQRTLPRTKLLQQLKKHRGRAAFRGEEERRARLVAELQQARLTGVRFKVPAETMSAKLANLPEGVSVARGRIEVGFDGAENALERLFALAQALGNDYVRFEELVGR